MRILSSSVKNKKKKTTNITNSAIDHATTIASMTNDESKIASSFTKAMSQRF